MFWIWLTVPIVKFNQHLNTIYSYREQNFLAPLGAPSNAPLAALLVWHRQTFTLDYYCQQTCLQLHYYHHYYHYHKALRPTRFTKFYLIIYTGLTISVILGILLTELLRLLSSPPMISKLWMSWTWRTKLRLWAANGQRCLKMLSPTLLCPCHPQAMFWAPPTKAAEVVESDKTREV